MIKIHQLILFFLILINLRADAQFMFRRTYGLGSINDGRSVIQTSDNGYAICGSTTPLSGGQTNFYLLKTDSMGVSEFQYSYGGSGIDQTSVLIQMPDSGFLMAGYSNSYSLNNDYDVLIIRTDKIGNLIWTKSAGTPSWDFIYDMKPTPDGNYILAGNSYGSPNGSSSGYLIKIDSVGNVLWQNFIQYDQLVNLKKIVVKNDGSFIVCGSVSPSVTYPTDGFIAFLDVNGDTLRTEILDNGKHETINAIDFFSNGDLALSGSSTDSAAQNNKDEMILRRDINGNTVWSFVFPAPGTDEINDLFVYNDTLVIIGSTTSYGQGNSDFHIARFDINGTYINANTYGGNENEFCYSALLTNDLGFILVGSSTSYAPGLQSIFLVKSDSIFSFDPNVTINITEQNDKSGYRIYPNPSSGILNINSDYYSEKFNLRLIDTNGKIIFDKSNQVVPLKLNLSLMKPGFYYLELINNDFIETKKIIISK